MVAEHLNFMAERNITVQPELRHLNSINYCTRFIAASKRCTTKPLSKLRTSCLSIISCHIKQYCSGIYSRTGVNCYWIIHNSQKVLSALITFLRTARYFDSYDFLHCIPVFPCISQECFDCSH